MATAYAASVLATPNLLGFWTLGDSGSTFADSSGNSNTATIHGSVTTGATGLAVGDATTAATFNGSNGYASFASSSVFDFDHDQPVTVASLIKVSSIGNNQEGPIFCKEQVGGSPAYKGWNYGIIGTGTNTFVLEVILCGGAPDPQLYVKGSIAMNAGTVYHVLIAYSGSGAASGISLWVNGVVDAGATVVRDSLAGNSIRTSVPACIGARQGSGGDIFFPGVIQYVTLYGACAPNGGDSTQAGYGHTQPYNIRAPAEYCIGLLGAVPIADPVVPNIIVDTDISGDIDDTFDIWSLCYLHTQGKCNLIGVTVTDSSIYCVSSAQAILDYWGINVPVYAYQGTSLPSTDYYGSAVGARFEPGDATNVGCTAVSISGGGTLNQVGDVLTVPGGTLATVRGRATKLTVSSVSSGAITGFSISDSGSYGTGPSGTITLPNLHGGTAASVTLTMTTHRGNYTNSLSGIRKLVANNSNVYIFGIGYATTLAQLLASASNAGGDGLASGVSMLTSNCKALVWAAGFASSCTPYGVAHETNMTDDSVSSHALVSGSPVWPTPIIECGIENVIPNGDFTNGIVDIKPPGTSDPLTNPMYYAYQQYIGDGGAIDGSGGRPWYSGLGTIWLTEGFAGGKLYWGTIGGTETIDASTGANSNTNAAGTPPWSTLRKKASDAALIAYGNSLLAKTPSPAAALKFRAWRGYDFNFRL